VTIRQVDADELVSSAPAFGALLADAVEGGASVSFVDVPSAAEAAAFWLELVPDVRAGFRLLLGAFEADGTLVGTVQIARRASSTSRTGETSPSCWSTAPRGGAAWAPP
jgi:hypothetical protein